MSQPPVCFVSLFPSGSTRMATTQHAQVLELRWTGLLSADDWTGMLAPRPAGHCGEAVALFDLRAAVILADLDALAAGLRQATAEELRQPPPPCALVVPAPLAEAVRRYCWAQARMCGAVRLAFTDRERAEAWARREARRRSRAGHVPPTAPRPAPVLPAGQCPESAAQASRQACDAS